MKNLWIKFGCFLTGYNYEIIKNSSEASVKSVKKYLSALVIVSILWSFIGYAFTQRYLHGNLYASLAGALLMVVVVIQIERQIILSIRKNYVAYGFRFLIAILMAIIGSIILDQIIFKDDIEKTQINNLQMEVNRTLPIKTLELTSQIQQLDQSILSKEQERVNTIIDIEKNPTIKLPSSNTVYKNDSTGKLVVSESTVITTSITNPKADMILSIDQQLKDLREQKTIKEKEKLNIREVLEKEIKSKTPFLDELKALFSILDSSKIAMTVWILLFLFFLFIELFVLVNKMFDPKTDYENIILHQMDTNNKRVWELNDQQQ